jgi:(2Fe-2S) ferredoxin
MIRGNLPTRHAQEAIVLLARSAIAAAPVQEMERFRRLLVESQGRDVVVAFTEQGRPSLRDALVDLHRRGIATALVVAMAVPFEPSMVSSLTRSLKRWSAAGSPLPTVRLVPLLQQDDAALAALCAALDHAPVQLDPDGIKPAEGSLVPGQKRRVLVCMGGPCVAAGAETLWGHLRNEQERLKLRAEGDGTMSAKTSCLGPCNLAPVIQVWPEGTYYAGLDERDLDRIIAEHLLEGRPAEDLAYAATGAKQVLRPRRA